MLQKRHLLSILFINFLLVATSYAADVPQYMEFAGMKLHILESARKKIAADVDALISNPKYFQLKVERINMYFPIIEKILEEEGLPEDFKYLVVQESSLISDAVSTSNAVGYWQFKKESALEVGMVVDRDVDERKHIVAATRGAARYLKRNNFYLQNWVYTLQSYNNGLGGTQRSVNQRHIGAEKMDIDGNTHWYVLKFLAHKLAFEDAIGKSTDLPVTLLQYPDCKGKTLEEIAEEMNVPLADLELYNKWLNRKRVPEDRDYIVIIPAPAAQAQALLAKLNVPLTPAAEEVEEVIPVAYQAKLTAAFPVLKEKKNRVSGSNKIVLYTINGKPGIQAQPGDNSARLAQKADISREKFLLYNDLKSNEALIPGEVYYLRKKRNRAKVEEHIVTEGETLWKISQMYGLTMKALMRKNRMKRPEKLQHGRVLWLRNIRPATKPVEIRAIPKPATVIATKPAVKTQETKTVTKPAVPSASEKTKETPVTQKPDKPVQATNPAESPAKSAVQEKEVEVTIAKEQPAPADQPSSEEPSSVKPSADPTSIVDSSGSEPEGMHTVTTGQTLYALAKIYHVSVAQLRLWNNLQETDGLKVGQTLRVSPPAEAAQATAQASGKSVVSAEEFEEYIVRQGDSLYKIAKMYNVSVQELQEWNGKKDYTLAVGEKLKVKRVN